MGGKHSDRRAAQLRLAERIRRNLLTFDFSQEASHTTQARDLLGASGNIKQRTDGVQVSVGPTASLTTDARLLPKSFRPSGLRPEQPQRLLRRAASTDGMLAATQELGKSASSVDILTGWTVVQQLLMLQRETRQLHRRPGQRRAGQLGTLRLTEGASQTPCGHTVQAAERRGEQKLCLLTGRHATSSGYLKRQQQWAHRRVSSQGNLVACHFDRYPGGNQGPGQPGNHC